MRKKLSPMGALVIGWLFLLTVRACPAAAQGQPAAQSSAGLPVEPPNGWDPVAWTRFRSYCLRVAKKAAKHSAMSISEIQTAKMCMAYGRPSLGQLGTPPLRHRPASEDAELILPTAAPQVRVGSIGCRVLTTS
jgi:hypothetical protein